MTMSQAATVELGPESVQGFAATPDTARRDDLIRSHVALAHHLVSEIAARIPKHVNRDDLESAAFEGLTTAAGAFDPERGSSFSHFALIRIRGAILDELRTMDWAPRSLRRDARKLEATVSSLSSTLGRPPTDAEVATSMGVPVTSVSRMSRDVERATVVNYESLMPNGSGEIALPAVRFGPESIVVDRERRAYLADAIRILPDRLRKVVIEYFFEERPMQDIADDLGVTESRVSQMRAEALELIRDGLNSQLEPEALEVEVRPNGRVARRKAAYYTALASASTSAERVSNQPIYLGGSALASMV
jgi:RNA polymerase sigma factor for flagellar operon FliA